MQQHCAISWHVCSDDDKMLSDGDVNSPAPAALKPAKASRPRAPAANQPKAKPPVAPAAGKHLLHNLAQLSCHVSVHGCSKLSCE